MIPTPSPSMNLLLTPKKVLFILSLLLIFSCTKDEDDPFSTDNFTTSALTGNPEVYRGIFASKNSLYRGVFELTLPGGGKSLNKNSESAIGKITLHTGEVFQASSTNLSDLYKSPDVLVKFDSEDLSFTFFYDEKGNPQITNVIFKNEGGEIVAAEHTEDSQVTPVTGTYKCTNCQDQDTTLNGILLNNEQRTFNMLLTKKDGTTSLSIQALVGILVETNIAVQETCTTNGDFTFCSIKSGDYTTKEPITWSGVHRYNTIESTGAECSSIAGIFDYTSAVGSIQGEFKSDSSCPDNYFVSATGKDTNTGLSPEDAWLSINKVNSIDLKPGTAVFFEGGKEFPGTIILNNKDAGSATQPVKISSYGSGRAKINAGNGLGINAYNTAGIIIDNLIFAGSGMNINQESGIQFYNDLPGDQKLDFVEIRNCEVYGFRKFGIVIGSWNKNSGFKNVLIEKNKVHDILDVGISSYGEFSSTKIGYAHSNLIVRNCEVYNIIGYSKSSHSGNGIVLSDVQYSTIEYCTAYNSGSGNTNCGGPVGIWYWDADNVTIQFCEAYNMSSGSGRGCDGGGFDMDGGVTNGVMQYNYSHDNDGAGFLVGQFTGARPMSNITVRYNISENDAATNGGSVYLFNGQSGLMKDIYVYNNTFYLSEQPGNLSAATIKYGLWKPVKENINFYNNILYAENGADLISVPSGYEGNFKGNLYHTSGSFNISFKGINYSSLANFQTSGKEMSNGIPVGLQANPQLISAGNGGTIGFGNSLTAVEAYKLQSTSPAFKAGINLTMDQGSRDFYGNHLSKDINPHIGAYQGQ